MISSTNLSTYFNLMIMDFKTVFLADLDWSLALQIVLRTLIMFSVILVFLRLSGKKGVSQLSIFEVAIIIALGSAAGDPMANPDNAMMKVSPTDCKNTRFPMR